MCTRMPIKVKLRNRTDGGKMPLLRRRSTKTCDTFVVPMVQLPRELKKIMEEAVKVEQGGNHRGICHEHILELEIYGRCYFWSLSCRAV